MKCALFHLIWVAMCGWVLSPVWTLLAATRVVPSEGYGIFVPFGLVAVAVLQWWAGGGAFPLHLRATPWVLLGLVAVVARMPGTPWMFAAFAAAVALGLMHAVLAVLLFEALVRKPRY